MCVCVCCIELCTYHSHPFLSFLVPVVIELLSKEYALSEGDQEVLRVGVRRTGFIVEDIVVSLEIRQKVFVGQDGVIGKDA